MLRRGKTEFKQQPAAIKSVTMKAGRTRDCCAQAQDVLATHYRDNKELACFSRQNKARSTAFIASTNPRCCSRLAAAAKTREWLKMLEKDSRCHSARICVALLSKLSRNFVLLSSKTTVGMRREALKVTSCETLSKIWLPDTAPRHPAKSRKSVHLGGNISGM